MKLNLPKLNTKHRGDIQVLRAFAVILVILYHLKIIKGGFLGVDIFFVISGYVITSNLVKSEGSLKEKLTTFYLRRAKRILPSSLVVVILTALLAKFILAPIYQGRFRVDALWSSLMGANIGFGLHNLDYLQATTAPSPFLHYWSLGVEEQFYILWPLFFFAFFATRKKWIIWLVPVFTLIALVTTSRSPVFSFYLPSSRAFQFLLGASLVAFSSARKNKVLLSLVGWIGLISSALLISDTAANPNKYSLIPTIATALVIYADSKIFTFKTLQFIGEVSFTLYLVHWPIILFFGKGTQDLKGATLALALVTMAVATLALTIFVELPFRYEKFGNLSPRKWIAILACATLLAQAVYLIPNKKVSGFTIDLAVPIIYQDGCHLNQRQSDLGKNCTWGSSGPKVLLTGDSHAAQWFPALQELASQGKLQLTSQTKSSCPFTSSDVKASGQMDLSCNKWHKNILQYINTSHFDYIIFSNFDKYGYSLVSGTWSGGISDLVNSVQTTTHIVQIIDTPKPPSDSAACLSTHLNSPALCNFDQQVNLKVANTKLSYIDPTSWLCDGKVCSATLNGFNTYRDGSHISMPTSKFLADKFYKALLSNNRS